MFVYLYIIVSELKLSLGLPRIKETAIGRESAGARPHEQRYSVTSGRQASYGKCTGLGDINAETRYIC